MKDRTNGKYGLEEMTKLVVRLLNPTRIVLYGNHGVTSRHRRYLHDGDILFIVLETLPERLTVHKCAAMVYRELPPMPLDVDILVFTEEDVAQAVAEQNAFVKTVMEEGRCLHELDYGRAAVAG